MVCISGLLTFLIALLYSKNKLSVHLQYLFIYLEIIYIYYQCNSMNFNKSKCGILHLG